MPKRVELSRTCKFAKAITLSRARPLSCQVTYHGHWAPQIVCRDGDNNTLEASNSTTENSTITHEINVTATASMNGGSFTCTTNFPDPLDPLPGEDEATNVPDYEHIHTFPQVTVHCKCSISGKSPNPTYCYCLKLYENCFTVVTVYCKSLFCGIHLWKTCVHFTCILSPSDIYKYLPSFFGKIWKLWITSEL